MLVADPAVGRQMEVHVELVVAADVGDVPVPERDQVLGGEPGELGVVEAQGAHARERAADADDRLAELEQTRRLAGGELERHGDDRIHPLAQQEVLEHAAALVGAAAEVVERQVVALLEQRALGALDDGAEEPAVEERDDDADVARAAGREAGGARRDDVAQLLGGRDHAIARGGRHRTAAAQGARHSRRGDSRGKRHLVDAGHDSYSASTHTVVSPGTVSRRRAARSRRRRVRQGAARCRSPCSRQPSRRRTGS